jgi:hypothetical protein
VEVLGLLSSAVGGAEDQDGDIGRNVEETVHHLRPAVRPLIDVDDRGIERHLGEQRDGIGGVGRALHLVAEADKLPVTMAQDQDSRRSGAARHRSAPRTHPTG